MEIPGVIKVIGSGKTKDPFLALCIRNVWLLTAYNDIDLEVKHTPGTRNTIADTLSRIHSPKSLNSEVLQGLMGNYQWDIVPHSYFDLSLHI